MIATEALPFVRTRQRFTPLDIQSEFGLSLSDARAVIHQLFKRGEIHTVYRGGGSAVSVYALGPKPRAVPAWVPARDMTQLLSTLAQGAP